MTIRPIPQKVISEAKLPGKPNEGLRTNITDKKGREWTEITYDHGLSWRVRIGALAVLASLGTVFFGLILKTIRNLWLKAISGKEIFIIKKEKVAPQTQTIDQVGTKKIGKIESTVEEPKKKETENLKTKKVSESVKEYAPSEIEINEDKQKKDLTLKENNDFKNDNQETLTELKREKKLRKKESEGSKADKISEVKKEVHSEIEVGQDEQEKDRKLKEDDDFKNDNQETLTEHEVKNNSVKTEEDPIKKQILDDFGLEMVEALGGADKVLSLPIVDKHWDGSFNPQQFSAPIMRGKLSSGRSFLFFCYQPYGGFTYKGDFVKRHEDGSWEVNGRGIEGELDFLEGSNRVIAGSDVEKHMLDRIKRLMIGSPVGKIKRYEKNGRQMFWSKDNIDDPQDAYLKGEELKAFMKLSTISYERDPSIKGAQLLLYDFNQPGITKQKIEEKPIEIEQDPVKKQILEDFGVEMVEALGGVDKVMQFPVIENWDRTLSRRHFTSPIMRGYYKEGSVFLLFSYIKYDRERKEYNLMAKVEYLGREKNENGWRGDGEPSFGELSLALKNNLIPDGSFVAHCMLDRIKRLISNEPLGVLQQYEQEGEKTIINSENSFNCPTDAYLKDEKLSSYMKLDTVFYERDPTEGSEIILWDPSKSNKENQQRLNKEAPHLKAIKKPK